MDVKRLISELENTDRGIVTLTGAPNSGKSYFIEQSGWYCLELDQIQNFHAKQVRVHLLPSNRILVLDEAQLLNKPVATLKYFLSMNIKLVLVSQEPLPALKNFRHLSVAF